MAATALEDSGGLVFVTNMEQNVVYTVKEIVTKMAEENEDMRDRLIDMHNTMLRILEEQKKTNGRVTKNADDISLLKTEHSRWKAIFATVSVIFGGAWSAVTFVFK